MLLLKLADVALALTSTALLQTVLGQAAPAPSSAQWPYTPWTTKGRDVVNSRGEAVTIVGTNWPGAGELMLPEGLQYTSASSMVSRLADAGFNFVRHTYAIEMIDDIYTNGGKDVSIQSAALRALGQENGTKVMEAIVEHNKGLGWTANTTRLEVLGDIAKLEAQAGIVMHLDNHVSKAKWCCTTTDGNAWFGDKYFDRQNWKRGLAYMAKWAKGHANIPSISLRNELRRSDNDSSLQYDWVTLASNVTSGADAIHDANPDLLITISGLSFSEDVSAFTAQSNLNTAPASGIDAIPDADKLPPAYFRLDEHSWKDKAVFEMHLYNMSGRVNVTDCEATKASLYRLGFNALGIDKPKLCSSESSTYDCPDAKQLTPVWLTEFGQSQDATLYNGTVINCLRDLTLQYKIGWAMWGLAGSYYTREGEVDKDDTWALTNHQWSDWRDPSSFQGFWRRWIKEMGKTNLET